MKKRKTGIWLSAVAVLAALAIFFFIRIMCKKNESAPGYVREIDVSDELTGFIEYALECPLPELDAEYTGYIEENCMEEIDSLSSSSPEVFYFLKASFASWHDDDLNAEEYFSGCLDLYYSDTSVSTLTASIYGRCCYELGYFSMENGDSDSMEEYHDLMVKILTENSCTNLLINYDSWICANLYTASRGAEHAMQIADEMIELAEAGDYDDMGYVYTLAADTYSYAGNETRFIDYMMKAVDIYSEGQDEDDIYDLIFCMTNIGNEYVDEENYSLGRQYLEDAYAIDIPDNEESNAEMKAYVSQNLAFLEIQAGNLEEASRYLEACREWIKKEPEETGSEDYTALLTTMAEYETAVGNYDVALEYLNESKTRFEEAENFSYTNFDISLEMDFAEVYYLTGDYVNALSSYKNIEWMVKYRGLTDSNSYLRGLCKVYEAMGDYEEALTYADEYQEYLEEKVNDSNTAQAAYLEYVNSQQTEKISNLESTKNTVVKILIVIVIAMMAAAHLFVIVIKKNNIIRKMSDDFKHESETDGLTGLNNRRYLDTYLSEKWPELLKNGDNMALAMLDVDYFKKYNDFYGHLAGDNVLQEVSRIIRRSCSEYMFAARYGGEEFVIVMPGISRETAEVTLAQFKADLHELNIPHERSTVSDRVSVSIGAVYITPEDGCVNYEKGLAAADEALYKAKEKRDSIYWGEAPKA